MSNKLIKNNIALDRGKRVKFLRSYIAAMTGEKFAECCGLARGTVTNWETGKGKKGLTEKGSYQIANAMQKIGIHCSAKWLLEGEGAIPKIVDQSKLSRLHYPILEAPQTGYVSEPDYYAADGFSEEVTLFKKRYPAHLLHTFQDESMAPIYSPYDCVAGPRLMLNEIKAIKSSICIVLLQPDNLLVRRIRFEEPEQEVISFYGINAEAALEYPPMFRVPIESIIAIAPVTRLWRNVTRDEVFT